MCASFDWMLVKLITSVVTTVGTNWYNSMEHHPRNIGY